MTENKVEFKKWFLGTFGTEYTSTKFDRETMETEAEKAVKKGVTDELMQLNRARARKYRNKKSGIFINT